MRGSAVAGVSAVLALLSFGGGGIVQAQGDVITNDTFFYGQSPPVYPSPKGAGTGEWAAAYSKAAALVAQMTLEEKANLTVGVGSDNGCVGSIPSIPRLGFPGLCLQDAGNGVRQTDGVNAWASGIHSGASWNKGLTYERGRALGGEFLRKGANVALGPVVGPLGRVVSGGRNWEGFSNDPYLAGRLAAETVRGIQEQGVITSTKHFIANEQELNRMPSGSVESLSSNIDDKTMHELYLWPFADAVHAGSINIMCSYQRINNSYGCQNSKTLNGLLKTELGFQGFVVSDWYAQHSGYASAAAGMDMVMPNSNSFWADGLLTTAVQNGSLPEARLDDMATRILAGWFKLDQNTTFPKPGFGIPSDLTAPHTLVDARDPAAQPVLFQAAVEGHVLVKNNGVLPLKKPKLLSVFGYDAKATDSYDLSAAWQLGFTSANITLVQAISGIGPPMPQIAANGTLTVGGGSGANNAPYISTPFDALSQRAYQDHTFLLWDFVSENPAVSGASDACLVFINAFAGEGTDRTGLHDDFSDSLVNNVADQCNNTIVVIHNAGVRLVDQFVEHPNVSAVLFAHLPGQDSGRAVVSLLYGDSNPSGKLPYTVAKNESDYGLLAVHAVPEGQFVNFPQSDFSEGIFIDYRLFDSKNMTPRYEFGFGLSYTTFAFANLHISKVSANLGPYPTGPIAAGGQTDLWDVLYQVTAEVTNTGAVGGAEVAQLYIGVPGGPAKQLRGFEKVTIGKGGSTTVRFDVMRRDLSVWDVAAQAWKLQEGEYKVWVGSSSRILPLSGAITI